MSQSVCWFFSSIARVCATMSERIQWHHLCTRCERAMARYRVRAHDEIPLEPHGCDPVKVFDETSVEDNVWRFVVYILWLKMQPNSFEKYLDVRACRADLWRDNIYKLWQL